jgi:hypothetical protein
MQVVFAEVVVEGTLLQLFALPVAGGAIGVPFASVEQPLQCVSLGTEISTSQPSATVELQSRREPVQDNTQLLPVHAAAEYVAPVLVHKSPLAPHWHWRPPGPAPALHSAPPPHIKPAPGLGASALQPPQLAGSELMLVSQPLVERPSQSANPALQVNTQLLPEQDALL